MKRSCIGRLADPIPLLRYIAIIIVANCDIFVHATLWNAEELRYDLESIVEGVRIAIRTRASQSCRVFVHGVESQYTLYGHEHASTTEHERFPPTFDKLLPKRKQLEHKTSFMQ